MRIRIAVPEEHASPEVIDAALEAVTRLDESMIRAGQSPTSRELVTAGAIWRPENMGDEHFDHGGTIAARGWGDCDDWAPLHAATLRASGEDPAAVARVVPSGPNTYHAIVERSDGSIDDPSIAAGMKPRRVSGVAGDTIDITATDPHDGRIYRGQLAPTTGPLSMHSGPGVGIRCAHVAGRGMLYEARCDLPIVGSPLVHVHNYYRRRPHRGRRVHGAVTVVGAMPYAFSCSARHPNPLHAMSEAITGAVLCGDAAELSTSLDRYKLLAMQAALSGMSPGDVREALIQQIARDVHEEAAATGTHPGAHTQRLVDELAAQGIGVGCIVGDVFSDIASVATGVMSAVADGVNVVAKAAGSIPWGDILHGVQAAVSVVPLLGTAASDLIAAAESAYDVAAAALSGDPIGGAIHAAYNFALGSVPGGPALHFVLDPVVTTLLNLAVKKEPIESAILNGILADVPDAPKIAGISPRTIAASLAQILVGHLGVKNTGSAKPKAPPVMAKAPPGRGSLFGGAASAAQRVLAAKPTAKPIVPIHVMAAKPIVPIHLTAAAAAPLPLPIHHSPIHPITSAPLPPPESKPLGVPHAAIHAAHATAAAATAPALPALRPGSPGAPPGASHWQCTPAPGGAWQCRWA